MTSRSTSFPGSDSRGGIPAKAGRSATRARTRGSALTPGPTRPSRRRGNHVHDGSLVPWIKQLKAWNHAHGAPLRSFHLETLAWSVFGTSSWWPKTFRTDWDAVAYFFRKAPDRLAPAGLFSDGAPAGWAYLTGEKRRAAVSKMRSAHDRCRRAEAAAGDGDLAAMHHAYREIFGNWYPR